MAPLFVMVSALVSSGGARVEAISGNRGVPVITLRRWRQWWRETFAQTRAWRWKRGELVVPPGEVALRCVLRRIRGRSLMWLLPWTGFCALGAGRVPSAESVSDRLG